MSALNLRTSPDDRGYDIDYELFRSRIMPSWEFASLVPPFADNAIQALANTLDPALLPIPGRGFIGRTPPLWTDNGIAYV